MTYRLRDIAACYPTLTPLQQTFISAFNAYPRVILRCGRQVGKTETLARWALDQLMLGRQGWWIAPTHKLCNIGFARCERLINLLPLPLRKRFKIKRSAPYHIQFQCSELWFLTSSKPESLQGETNDFVIFDEAATERNLSERLEQYIYPTLMIREGQIIMASTPKGMNDFAKYSQSNAWHEIVASSYDSGLANRTWLDEFKASCEKEGRNHFFRQEILAEVIAEIGLFFQRLPEVAESDFDPEGIDDACGLDWGSSSPFSAVWIHTVRPAVTHVISELYATHVDPDKQAQQILAGRKARRYIVDPSIPEHVNRIWRNAGLQAQPGSRDRIGRWQLIRQMISNSQLIINPRCFNLIHEFNSVQIDTKNANDLIGDDHALDALGYALMYAVAPKPEQTVLSPVDVETHLAEQARREFLKAAKKSRRHR